MLVAQVPEFQILLKLAPLFGIHTDWALNQFTAASTRTSYHSIYVLEGSVPAGDDGENDNFHTCTELHENVSYMCNEH